jgi:hypothetical protein
MEVVLNLSWLVIAAITAVVFGVWSARQPDGAAARRLRWSVGLALVCVVALLFPIISVTDDLAPDTAALEEWTSARRVALQVIALAQHAPVTMATIELPQLLMHGPIALACLGLTSIPTLTVLSPATTTVWSFRAPPLAA